ncbi:MAG: transferase hexapeptide repeat family protein [Flavobacteriales bacterium]
MANIFEFEGLRPVVHPSAFIHPNATIIGDVVIGSHVYIGPSAVIRGDWGRIHIEDGCNVQENCTIHLFPGVDVLLESGAHLGHGCVVHGASIGSNALIGMNAVIMDRARIGAGCIVGALTLVLADTIVPDRKIIVGNPGRIIKDVTDEMLNWKTEGTAIYQKLPALCHQSMRPCEPLDQIPEDRNRPMVDYRTWNQTKSTD